MYADTDFQGESKDNTSPVANIGDKWNDKISSFRVHSGSWQFYQDENFETSVGRVFDSGEEVYWVGDEELPNDSITSLQPVDEEDGGDEGRRGQVNCRVLGHRRHRGTASLGGDGGDRQILG